MRKEQIMRLGKKSRKIIKEYIENEIKITRYEEIKPKPVPMKRVWRSGKNQ